MQCEIQSTRARGSGFGVWGSGDATNSVGIIYFGKIQSTHHAGWDATATIAERPVIVYVGQMQSTHAWVMQQTLFNLLLSFFVVVLNVNVD